MAIWWMTEALPLAVTSLVPLVLYPILGINKGNEIASAFFNSTNFLFMGGFLIALAMQEWNLHRRIALFIIKSIGGGTTGIISGFMLSAFLLSMFISNVATTVLLLPIGMAVIFKMEEQYGITKTKNFSISLMLAIAYSASIGGVATLVGTAPNLALQRIHAINFPNDSEITFANWLSIGLPISIIMVVIVWFLLNKFLYKIDKSVKIEKKQILNEYKLLGKFKFEEKTVLTILSLTGLLWLSRKNLDLEFIELPGWSNLFEFSSYIDDGTVAISMALLLFILPAKKQKRKILTGEIISKIPWDILLLFGGGFALAEGFQSSGLSDQIGNTFSIFRHIPDIVLVFSVCLVLTFLTELTSNTATTYTILPILASLAPAFGVEPLLLMLPATISASFAFMLPVATPPNAIVFGSKKLKIRHMIKAGIFLNLIGVLVVSMFYYFWGKNLF